MTKTSHHISVKGKSYLYTLKTISKNFTHVECREAAIDQEFANKDIPELLALLPEHIKAEQEYRARQDAILRFRVTGKEKLAIEKKASTAGFPNVSSYLRKVALK